MKQKLIILLSFIYLSLSAQKDQNKYAFAIVPIQYQFSSEPNQFQLNVLTRVELKKAGFTVFMSEGETIPDELKENKCLALNANVILEKSVFTSTLIFQLKDCFGKLVFESKGKSKEKLYKDAYKEALGIALEEFIYESGAYVKSYNEKEKIYPLTDSTSKEEDKPFNEVAVKYNLNGKDFWLLKKDENYILYQDKGETIFATLNQADRGTYAYDSESIDGAAYFNINGDLVVEYLAKNEVDVQKLIFMKR